MARYLNEGVIRERVGKHLANHRGKKKADDAAAVDALLADLDGLLLTESEVRGPLGGIACMAVQPVEGDTTADGHRILMGQRVCHFNRDHEGPHAWEPGAAQ